MSATLQGTQVETRREYVLACRIGRRSCALPLACVIETMRPLPIDTLVGGPPGVLGVALIRGQPTVVVDVRAWFGDADAEHRRFVTIRVGERVVALAVADVIGVRPLERTALRDLPPLLGDAVRGVIDKIGGADAELLVVLHAARLVADAQLEALAKGAP